MKNNYLLLAAQLLVLTTLGCQQSTSFKSSSDSSIAQSACVSNKAVDVNSLEIVGAGGALPGQALHLKLNEDLGCSASQSVTWTDASGNPTGTGSTHSSTFSKPGIYVVTAQVQSTGTLVPTQISYKAVVTPGLAVNGPQIGMAEVDNTFTLVVPTGVTVASASWDFGDGSPLQTGLGPIDYAYVSAGSHTLTVTVTLANGDVSVVSTSINVLAPYDGMECVNQLAISGPTTAVVGTPVNLTVFLPPCVKFRVNAINWSYQDGSAQDHSQSVTHTFTTPGTYHTTVDLYQGETNVPFVTLYQDIVVSAGSGQTTDPGTGSTGGEIPNPNLNECSLAGLQRQVNGELFTEDVVCGVNGHRTNTYRNDVTQTCTLQGEILKWVTGTTVKTLVTEGACQGQACEVPAAALNGQTAASLGLLTINGHFYLSDGASKTFYSSTLPAGACSEIATTRSCSNGVLGGSSSASNLTCQSGCPGFGPSGTTKTGVVTGSESVPRVCQYGETGIFDIFTQTSDQMCTNGQVSSSNTQRGTLQTPGICPTYNWVGSGTYSACSAACGGTQSQTFLCYDSNGAAAPAERCTAAPPVSTRVCDGNPDSVKRTETTTSTEEGNSCTMCPANQIGIVVNERTVTTTNNYACINHSVQLASTTVTDGAWNQEKYCRDYVPHRCSQDSLAIPDAKGRYQWMVKCQDKVPVIKQFLQAFDTFDTGTGSNAGISYNGKTVYPTFMQTMGRGADKVWIAPIMASASCNVPNGIYVAAVCTASCATPEQEILAQSADGQPVKYAPFLQAWQEKFKYVATLQSAASINAKRVVLTPVDFWVTELVDGDHEILTFKTKSGGQVRLTPNHPILTTDGRMKLAADWQTGESLVRLGGQADEIVSIEHSTYYGKVYNLFTKTNAPHKNVVVTNGFLNGTAFFQNDGASYVNKVILRTNLIQGALGK